MLLNMPVLKSWPNWLIIPAIAALWLVAIAVLFPEPDNSGS